MASRKISTTSTRGFSLVEVMVVIGLLAVVAGVSMFFSFDQYRGDSFHNERDLLISALYKARSQAVSNLCYGGSCDGGAAHGAHIETGSYTVFQDTYVAGNALNEVFGTQNKGVTIDAPKTITFSPLAATTTGATIRMTDVSGRYSDITIGSEGEISWTY